MDGAAEVGRDAGQPAHDLPAIVRAIRGGYRLRWDGYHGVHHWARVYENGLRVADANGADREVVALFALFHDSRRMNEHRDHGHGERGAELARSLRESLVQLADHRFDLLAEACRLHTNGHTTSDPTLAACWDADRLDLGRVGIRPRTELLSSEVARELRDWAHERAENLFVPHDTLVSWRALGDAVDR